MTEPQEPRTTQFGEGDRVIVEVESADNPFGATQRAEFDVTEVDGQIVYGEDPAWGDEVELILGGGTPHYAGAGKSGDCETVRIAETTDDGVTIHASGNEVFAL